MERARDRDLSWDYTDTGEDADFESSPLLGGDAERNFHSFTEHTSRRSAQREDLLLILESLETSSRVIRAALEGFSHSGPPTPLTASRTQLDEISSTSRWRHYCSTVFCTRILKWVLRYHVALTVIIQALNIGVISVLDELPGTRKQNMQYIILSSSILISLEVLSLIVIIIATVSLTRQVIKQKVSSWFLAQVYLATTLVFAGLYTVTYKLNHESWKDIGEPILKDPVLIVDLFLRMVHLSVSTATLCGSCVITPREWYNYVFVSTQMLLSFVYFAQILAQAMNAGSVAPFIRSQREVTRRVSRTNDDHSSQHTEEDQDDVRNSTCINN